jgi:hypothetical protein
MLTPSGQSDWSFRIGAGSPRLIHTSWGLFLLAYGAAVRDRPADREQDDEVLGAAGLHAQEAAGEAEA